jgi:hypothetical protein
MVKKIITKNRARIEILNYVLQFSTKHYSGDKKEGCDHIWTNITNAFTDGRFSDFKPAIGTLVIPTFCSFTKWYLSWVVDYKNEGHGDNWLLESIEDSSLCWWSNIQLYSFPKEKSDEQPQWRWSDDQWAFWDKWVKACKKRNTYITLPMRPIFTDDDGGVILKTRTRFAINDNNPEIKFNNWRKVTQKQMLEFYDYAALFNK